MGKSYLMDLRQIHNGPDTKVFYDKVNNIIVKENQNLKVDNIKRYMDFQQTTDSVVKVHEIIDDKTFSMEYINDIQSMVHPFLSFHTLEKLADQVNTDITLDDHLLRKMKKNDLLELIITLNIVWTKALEFSKTLDGGMMWTNGDFKLSNIAVINKDNRLTYKVLDPDSWELLPGYSSVESYYQCQFQLAFMTQTLINRIFYNG